MATRGGGPFRGSSKGKATSYADFYNRTDGVTKPIASKKPGATPGPGNGVTKPASTKGPGYSAVPETADDVDKHRTDALRRRLGKFRKGGATTKLPFRKKQPNTKQPSVPRR